MTNWNKTRASAIMILTVILGGGISGTHAAYADPQTPDAAFSPDTESSAKKGNDIPIVVGEPIIVKDPKPAHPKKK